MTGRGKSVALAVATALVVGSGAVAARAASAVPRIGKLSVSSGPVAGGTRVNVTGANFAKGATVRFGTTRYGTSVHVTSSKSLWVTAPAHPAATGDVRVHTSAGWSPLSSADRYRWVAAPTVSTISPGAGPTDGGTTVKVTGVGFIPTSTVAFGGDAAGSTHYVSATHLTAVSPAHGFGAVHVTVTNAYGRSITSTSDRFDYLDTPDPVPNPAVADVTATTVTLRWDMPAPPAKGVAVWRVEGTHPPTTPEDGDFVASVNLLHHTVVDEGLQKDTTYTYAIYAYEKEPVYSAPRTLTVTTAHGSRPDIPTGLVTNPATQGGAASCSVLPYGAVGKLAGGPLTLSARVSDPDGSSDQVSAHFRLWDLGGSGTDEPRAVADGTAGPGPGFGYTATYRIADTEFADGHIYKWDVIATNGSLTSASASPCYFRADFTSPTRAVITSPDDSFQVGTPAHFHITSSDPTPEVGLPSGFDHFEYSLVSSSGPFTRAPGTVSGNDATLELTVTPTVWGTNSLFVTAVDKAGNSTSINTYSYYVRS